MKLHLVTVGQKMPAWVEQGYHEYARRMPPEAALMTHEIALQKRPKQMSHTVLQRLMDKEGQQMLMAVPDNAYCVALEIEGRSLSTEQLAKRLQHWSQQSANIALLIGGPEGLAESCRQRAHESWSLSALTLPHPMVRVIVAEALYRAWTFNQGHPYHRA